MNVPNCTEMSRPCCRREASRRGAMFVAAMWVLVALVGLVLVMARAARVEALASGNRLAEAEAAAAARAGEQYVLAQVEAYGADATFASAGPAEAVPVGGGFFWVIRPDREADRVQDFGIDDEGSKVNINIAPASVLIMLPGMTPDIADAVVDWRDDNDTPSPYGAESEYYQSLGYRAKNGPFETVEELLLVKGMTPQILYGMDANRNGLLDEEESAAGGGMAASGTGTSGDTTRGLLPFVSVTGPGNAPGTQGQSQSVVNVNANNSAQAVQDVLRGALAKDRFATVGPLAANGRPFRNMIDFYVKTRMKPDEFALVASRLTTGGGVNGGRVNVNTAPREVLRALPNMEDSDVTALLAARASDVDTTTIAWVADALTDKAKAVTLGDAITGRSYRFSADVVGVSGDGKAYYRVRVMVNGTATPAVVTYRRDMTAAGWPMGPDERAVLRSGAALAAR